MNKYLGVLRWSLNYVDGTTNSEVKPMDEERRKWLMEALESQIVDPVDQMKSLIEIIKFDPLISKDKESEKKQESEEFYKNEAETLAQLLGFVENLDLARDFKKLGGLDIVMTLLQHSPNEDCRARSAEILAGMVQNHEELQNQIIKTSALEVLTAKMKHNLENKDFEAADNLAEDVAVLQAVSCLVRNSAVGTTDFLNKYHGMDIIKEVIETFLPRLLTKHQGKDETEMSELEDKEKAEIRVLRKALLLLKYLVDHVLVIKKMVGNKWKTALEDVEKIKDVDCQHLAQGIIEVCLENTGETSN